jgi:hypothetical protein
LHGRAAKVHVVTEATIAFCAGDDLVFRAEEGIGAVADVVLVEFRWFDGAVR